MATNVNSEATCKTSPPPLRSLINPGVSKRKDFPLRPSSMALVVIDIQKEFTQIDPSSKEYRHAVSFPRMVRNATRLVNTVRSNRDNKDRGDDQGDNVGKDPACGSEVIFVYIESLTDDCRDVSLDYKLSGPALSHVPGPSSRASFLPGLCPVAGRDICVPKTSCSVFQSTNLHYLLRNLNVEQLVLCGQLTDQCVESAVRDAADLGYLVTVAADACAALTEEGHEKGLRGMAGFARTLNTDQILAELADCPSTSSPTSPPTTLPTASPTSPSGQPAGQAETSPEIDQAQNVSSSSINIPPPSSFQREKHRGIHTALLRSLRTAGVKYLRYAIVDAFNTIRCKAVPLPRTISLLRAHQRRHPSPSSSPLDHPTTIAEICFAALPPYGDAPVAGANFTARNVLVLKPDFTSLRVLPYAPKTAMLMCTAHHQRHDQHLSPLCTRGLLERVLHAAEQQLKLQFCVGAELEFILYPADSSESKSSSPVTAPVDISTFANAVTLNQQETFIDALYDQLHQQDIAVELIHSESANGQLEVVLTYSDNVMQIADNVVFARETIRQCANSHGMKALFLPKTSMMQAGNGLHLHFSFRDIERVRQDNNNNNNNNNAFSDINQPYGISSRGASFIEGILTHLPSLLSFTLPTTNSFRRVGKGCWTGHEVVWSIEDKDVPVRVCLDVDPDDDDVDNDDNLNGTKHDNYKSSHVELKLSDATANIYLELAMVLSAGMDGIQKQKKLRPMAGMEELLQQQNDNNKKITKESLPKSLQESLNALKQNEYLLSILGTELSTAYIAVREHEIEFGKDHTLDDEVADALSKA